MYRLIINISVQFGRVNSLACGRVVMTIVLFACPLSKTFVTSVTDVQCFLSSHQTLPISCTDSHRERRRGPRVAVCARSPLSGQHEVKYLIVCCVTMKKDVL